MANEINVSASLTASKNGITLSQSASKAIDMAGSNLLFATQLIGTSSETVSLGEISGAPSAILIKNLDSTNYVEIGGDSGLTVFKIKIPAGQFAIFQPSSGTLYAKANTASVTLSISATEA